MVTIGIVVSETYPEITGKMLEAAQQKAKELGADVGEVIRVPGCFDIPLAVKRLLEMHSIDGVVTLGAVIKGETDHDQLVASIPADKIADLSLQYNKPVALGITGPGQTRQQAVARIPRAARVMEVCITLVQDWGNESS